MRINFEKYNPNWQNDFVGLKQELMNFIGDLQPKIEHIGSTSVQGLSAKPIIDILVGLESEIDLEKSISPLINNDYVYYQCYNVDMAFRRFFVKHKISPDKISIPKIISEKNEIPNDSKEHGFRLAHIHILPYDSEHWIRHIAFRDYLRLNPAIKIQYQSLKEELSMQEWKDGNDYNQAKDKFIKTEEQKAIRWYLSRK